MPHEQKNPNAVEPKHEGKKWAESSREIWEFIREGETLKAVNACQIASKTFPKNPAPLFLLSIAHTNSGDIPKAQDALEQSKTLGLPEKKLLPPANGIFRDQERFCESY